MKKTIVKGTPKNREEPQVKEKEIIEPNQKIVQEIEETAQKSLNSIGTFVEDEQTTLVLQYSQIPGKFSESEFDPLEFIQKIETEISGLTTKIDEIDGHSALAKTQFNQMKEVTEKLTDTRRDLQNLITDEQDLIHSFESRLKNVPLNQYRAEMAPIRRFLMNFFSRSEDEIHLKTNIVRSETKISQRQVRLLEINKDLSSAWISNRGYEDLYNELRKISDSFRSVRLNMGKLLRNIREDLKNEKIKLEEATIIQNYSDNINKLQKIAPEFKHAVKKNKKTLEALSDQLQNLENSALKKGSIGFNENVDQLVDSLVKEKI